VTISTAPSVADQAEEQIIVGVDTHNDVHVAAVITTIGVLLGAQAFPTTTAGYADLLTWARSHGTLRRAGVEGTSSHGTALTRYLRRNGVHVIEINRPDRAARRRRGRPTRSTPRTPPAPSCPARRPRRPRPTTVPSRRSAS
jgi:transposase